MTQQDMHDSVLEQINWTGMSLRQLAGAGRVVPGPIVDSWVDEWFMVHGPEGSFRERWDARIKLRAAVQDTVARCNK